IELQHNAPHLWRAAREIAGHLGRLRADVLCCSGYKPDIIGWLAGSQAGVPVVAIAHGWTAATWKVRCNEVLDRLVMRRVNCTVCVSEAQAATVRRTGVPANRLCVIRNAIQAESLTAPDPAYSALLHGLFARPRERIVAAAGRLSSEKGFDQ